MKNSNEEWIAKQEAKEKADVDSLPKDLLNNLTPEQYNQVMYALWVRFSNIQCANFLTVDGNQVDRFLTWLETCDDEDAWS